MLEDGRTTAVAPGTSRSDHGKASRARRFVVTHDTASPSPSADDGPVLVTGAGGPAGVAVIRALVAAGETVIGVDVDDEAVGLRLADHGALVRPASEAGYADSLVAAAAPHLDDGAHRECVVVPTVAEELPALWGAADRLRRAGIRTWVPRPEAVRVCVDKWQTFGVLRGAGVATPETGLRADRSIPGPWVVKPRFGRGSRHVLMVDDADSLAAALLLVPEPIVQHRLPGREFTADVLIEDTGDVAGVAPRWRTQTRGGISTHGTTFSDPAVSEPVMAAVHALGLVGAANVQGFRSDDGSVAITEINPRFSGGLPLSLAAGADLVGEYVRAVRGLPIRRERLVATSGVTMRRYFAELFDCGSATGGGS